MQHRLFARCDDKHKYPISSSYNTYKKSHPLQKYFAEKVGHPERIYLHAEIAAILAAGTQKIATLWVSRINSKKQYVMAKPCIICQEAIKAFDIKNVFFTNEAGIWERLVV